MLDVVVIGGGQGGLVAGFTLKQAGLSYVIVDEQARTGDRWRHRFEGLTLFTPNGLNKLPGYPAPKSQGDTLTKDEFADYLEGYAQHHQLAIRAGQKVTALRKEGAVFAVLLASGEQLKAKQIILATGAFDQPSIPAFAHQSSITQLNVDTLGPWQKSQAEPQSVLVVGDGASGRQLAKQLALAGHQVTLALGKPRHLIAQRWLGISPFYWFKWLGLLQFSDQSVIGRWLKQRDPFVDTQIRNHDLAAIGIDLVGRLTTLSQQAEFTTGEVMKPDLVVWATGYQNIHSWIEIPEALDDQGRLVHQQGVTPVSGLFALSTPWQRNRASALVYGLNADMNHLMPYLSKQKD